MLDDTMKDTDKAPQIDAPEIDARALRDAFGCFATGVTVISMLSDDGAPTGVTVSSFSSLSLTPPLCLFSLDRKQVSCRWIEAGRGFNVNVLGHDQQDAAWQFAKPAQDKFDGIDWYPGDNGLPLLTGSHAHFECDTYDVHDGGDHIIVVGRITRLALMDAAPLVFHRGKMAALVP